MTVLASLFSGISGIVANGSALSVSGDNIANMNTMAFKSGSALFESSLTQRIGDVEVGLGSRLAATNSSFAQGAFASSTRSTDLALNGRGFFVVENGGGERFYTRAGAFSRGADGTLETTVGGLSLLGYAIDDQGNESSQLDSIDLSNVSSTPAASTLVAISANLDPSSTLNPGGSSFTATSFEAAASTANFSVPAVVYDSLGSARSVVTYYRRTGTNAWEWYTLTDLANLQNPNGTVSNIASGTAVIAAGNLTFTTNGQISSVNYDGNGLTAWNSTVAGVASVINPGEILNAASDIPWRGASSAALANPGSTPGDTEFRINFGQYTSADLSAVITQFNTGTGSVVTSVEADGRSVGELQSIDITESGLIRGIFSNGESRDLFRLPIAKFGNDEGLARVGTNLYQETARSGAAILGEAASSGLGSIQSFALEQSNVDLASEFVKIIQFQRGFQASSRTISAAADLLQDLVNLGR